MGEESGRRIARAVGTEELGFPATPPKLGNVKLSRIEHAKDRGGCKICFPHGPETDNATGKEITVSWKSRRKTKNKSYLPQRRGDSLGEREFPQRED